MAQNRSALSSSDSAALRQRFAEREAGSLEALARTGRARLRQKLAALPVGVARQSFVLPLSASLAGLAILGAAFTFLPRHEANPTPVLTAGMTPAAPPAAGYNTSTVVAPAPRPVTAPKPQPPAPTAPASKRIPAPAIAVVPSMPPSLQAASASGAGGESAAVVEPELRMVKTSAGVAVTWDAAAGEKFIISKTCFTDHNFTDTTTGPAPSSVLLNSGEWVDTAPDAAGCDQVHYEVRRVA